MSRYSLGIFAEKTDAGTGRSTKLQCGWRVCIVVSVVLSGIAFAMAICKSYPRMDLEFDYMGIIIAIFSLLVSLLIGWQIYNAIELNKRVSKNAERLNNSFRAQSIILGSLDKKRRNIMEEWIEDNFSAIPYALKGYDPSITSTIIDNIIEAIEEDKKHTHPSYKITSEQKQNFIKALDGISLNRVKNLRKLIMELPE